MLIAYKKFWSNYVNFSGRSTRSDYWYVVLMNIIITGVIDILVEIAPELSILNTIYLVVTLIPGIALITRRFHDINKSGFNYFWIFVPIVGLIIFLVYLCTASVEENNKYGERA